VRRVGLLEVKVGYLPITVLCAGCFSRHVQGGILLVARALARQSADIWRWMLRNLQLGAIFLGFPAMKQLNYQRNEFNEAEVKQETTKHDAIIMKHTNRA